MHIIGFTYEADFHCVFHCKQRFGNLLQYAVAEPTEHEWNPLPFDSEGNEVRVVYDTHEWLELNDVGEEIPATPQCSECYMKFKIGDTVKVIEIVTDDSDADWYWRIGQTGMVTGYDATDDMYLVTFSDGYTSAFYQEELELQ